MYDRMAKKSNLYIQEYFIAEYDTRQQNNAITMDM